MKFTGSAWRACTGATATGLLLAAVLSACGAGVAGTGGGIGDAISYIPAGLCAAPFADASLDCAIGVKDPDRGTAPVQWTDANQDNGGATVLAVPQVNSIELQLPCRRMTFTGRWGELPDSSQAFVGRATTPDVPDGVPAVLYVRETPDEPDAVGNLQIVDASGTLLFGPWQLRRVAGEVTFGACPP